MTSRFLPRVIVLPVIAIVTSLIVACASVNPKNVPANLSAAQLMKEGQVFSGLDEYDNALVYFELIKARYPDDAAAVAEADYNIANVKYKTNKIAEARQILLELLVRYQSPGAERLPPFIPVLAEKVLKMMDETSPSPSPSPSPN